MQFALTTFDGLRGFDFGADAANKVWEKKLAFMPPETMESNLPNSPNTSITSPNPGVLSPK